MEPNPFEASFAAVSHTPPNSGKPHSDDPASSSSSMDNRDAGSGNGASSAEHGRIVSPKAPSSPPHSSSSGSFRLPSLANHSHPPPSTALSPESLRSGPLSPALLDHPLAASSGEDSGSITTSLAPVATSNPAQFNPYLSRS
ncbi:hypothetical protein BJ684DRAFT_21711, partial [Piptocephalis cylindrospora]